MNFKILIIALIALPLSLMAQNRTNQFDNVFIKNGLTFTGGTPGANKVLTSDAAGNYTPQALTSVFGPFAVTNGNNFFTTASVNTFNAPTFMVGRSNIIGTVSTTNIVNGILMMNTNQIDANDYLVFVAPDGTRRGVTIGTGAGNNLTSLKIGDFYNTLGLGSRYGSITYNSSQNVFGVNSVSATDLALGAANNNYMIFPSTGNSVTIGMNGSSASTFVGTLNGMAPANFLTNITSATLTVTGQGTHTINVEGGSGAAALTNASNFFTAVSTNTFNAVLLTSNLTMRGGLIVARSEKTANYTNTSSDYMISWKGTTVAQPTNFLATGHSNGRTFVIKDGQRSASTTNIIVKPLGTDTIMGTNAFNLNINSQSITITFDGTSNWEIN